MRFTHRDPTSQRAGQLPLGSLIDVVFLLLIFFLVTLRFVQEESELASALQSDEGGGEIADLQPQIVEVITGPEQTPVFRLGTRVMTNKLELTQVLRQLPKDGGVFVRPSNEVPVSATAAALQACRDAGFDMVTYVPVDG